MDDLKKKYGDDLRIVTKHLVVHPNTAMSGALAYCAASKQGKAHEIDKLIWEKSFKARQFDPDDFPDIDLVVAFDRGQSRVLRNWARNAYDEHKVRLLLEFDPELSPLQDVPDPYYSDDATFDQVLGMIERSTSALFRQLAPALRQGLR